MPITYASIEDYQVYFGPVETIETSAIDDPGALNLDSDRLDRALIVASAEMDVYLSRKYDIEVLRNDTPEVLIAICLDITRYRLVIHRPPEDYKERYTQAIARLKDLQSGRADLGGTITDEGTVDADNARTPRGAYSRATARVLTRSRLSSL